MKNYFFILTLLMTACSSGEVKKTEPAQTSEENATVFTEAQMKTAGIQIGKPVKQVMNADLKVNGVVDVPPQNIVSVSYPLGGYLKNTKLLPGMHVYRGEVIGTIEDQGLVQLQQDYLTGVARLGFLKQEYERQKTLNENKVNADKVFQLAKAEYESQQVLVKANSEKLKLAGINPAGLNAGNISRSVALHSPINGFVAKVNVNIGKFVNPTDVLFELINPDDLHAALTVFEKDIARVKIGQHAQISFVDDPDRKYLCEVILVTRNVDENRTATLHCHFETRPKNLLPGMFLNAEIRVADQEALTVPEEAVVRYANKQYVMEVTGTNAFRMLEVQTGITENGIIEIKGDNALAGKTLVLKNAYAVLSKIKNTSEEEE